MVDYCMLSDRALQTYALAMQTGGLIALDDRPSSPT